MDQTLLVTDQLNRGHLFVKDLVRRGFDVAAAVWLKEDPEASWYLYLISKVVDEVGTHEAYRKLVEVTRRSSPAKASRFDLLQVKLIGTATRLAADVEQLIAHNPGGAPIAMQGARLGGEYYDEVYAYPSEALKAI